MKKVLQLFYILLITLLIVCTYNVAAVVWNSKPLSDISWEPKNIVAKGENIHVAVAVNEKYAPYLAVTMASILLNSKDNIYFHIINSNLSDESKDKLTSLKSIRDFSIEFLPVNDAFVYQLPNSLLPYISPETNVRLIASTILPDIDKLLFIDADLVFEGDIADLWQVDVSDVYIAAVRDQYAQIAQWTKRLPLPKDYQYLNTGIMLINTKKWREDNVENEFKKLAKEYAEEIDFPEQDLLNMALWKSVKYLPLNYNAMPLQDYADAEQMNEAFSNPQVIHWAGRCKPWKCDFKYAEYFWKYARYTPYYMYLIMHYYPQNIKIFIPDFIKFI